MFDNRAVPPSRHSPARPDMEDLILALGITETTNSIALSAWDVCFSLNSTAALNEIDRGNFQLHVRNLLTAPTVQDRTFQREYLKGLIDDHVVDVSAKISLRDALASTFAMIDAAGRPSAKDPQAAPPSSKGGAPTRQSPVPASDVPPPAYPAITFEELMESTVTEYRKAGSPNASYTHTSGSTPQDQERAFREMMSEYVPSYYPAALPRSDRSAAPAPSEARSVDDQFAALYFSGAKDERSAESPYSSSTHDHSYTKEELFEHLLKDLHTADTPQHASSAPTTESLDEAFRSLYGDGASTSGTSLNQKSWLDELLEAKEPSPSAPPPLPADPGDDWMGQFN